jgi:hypothetical protein
MTTAPCWTAARASVYVPSVLFAHCGQRVVFQQGHVLEGRRMIHHARAKRAKTLFSNSASVTLPRMAS